MTQFFQRNRVLVVVGGGIAAFLLLLVVWALFSWNGVQKDGVRREKALNAQYLDNQNELGKYISEIKETFQIAEAKADKLNTVLSDAVKGRYEAGNSAVTPGGTQPAGQRDLISAVVEAYPDIQAVGSGFDQLLAAISAGREAYKNKQSRLLDILREYDQWRESGIFHSKLVSLVGFPSRGLEARIGRKVYRGDAARDQMYLIILPSDARGAYESGEMEPLDFGEQ